jgi:hypothetical protein
LSGGTPPRQGTQLLLARDVIENLRTYCSGLECMAATSYFEKSPSALARDFTVFTIFS